MTIAKKSDYQSRYRELSKRVIDDLTAPGGAISLVPLSRAENLPDNLRWLVDATAKAGRTNEYDLSLPMRRKNYNPNSAFNAA